jgi:hypothetical protein
MHQFNFDNFNIIILCLYSDEEGVVANLQRLSKGAGKKKVMRPQPKLDVDR